MKTKWIIGTLLLAMALTVQPVQSSFAQATHKLTKKEQRKLERKKKNEAKEKKAMEERMQYAKMLKEKNFVFQADQLMGPRGESYSVSSDINFLAVLHNKVVFQFGFEGITGWNGVGGFTLKGTSKDYKFYPGKKRNSQLMVRSKVLPHIGNGSAYFQLSVMDNGRAQLNIMMSNGGILEMWGRIVSNDKAHIFVGQTPF